MSTAASRKPHVPWSLPVPLFLAPDEYKSLPTWHPRKSHRRLARKQPRIGTSLVKPLQTAVEAVNRFIRGNLSVPNRIRKIAQYGSSVCGIVDTRVELRLERTPLALARTTSYIRDTVPDLTHPKNVAMYRTWNQHQREVAFVQLLRLIRKSSTYSDTAIVSKPGKLRKHPSLATQQDITSPMDIEAEAQ
ncbi:hypothetical protein BC826DRAFT_1178916 [Russula brevipes]|nr:hypothetical protein BC826DRAFT_1178916 [Russula brevipes]